jgi:hypothetical protein
MLGNLAEDLGGPFGEVIMKSTAPGPSVSPPRSSGEAPRTDSPQALRTIGYDINHWAGTWGAVFTIIWRATTTVSAAKALAMHVRQGASRSPSGRVALLMIFEDDALPCSPDAKTALANMLRFNAEELVCLAVCGRAARTMCRGLARSARPAFALEAFVNGQTGIEWVRDQLAREGLSCGEAADFERAVRSARPRAILYPR